MSLSVARDAVTYTRYNSQLFSLFPNVTSRIHGKPRPFPAPSMNSVVIATA